MKERPILFSAPMVRALLAGKKTQTRRTIRPGHWKLDGEQLPDGSTIGGWAPVNCPYGVPSDRLWVRETWKAIDRQCDGVNRWDHRCDDFCTQRNVYYRATPRIGYRPRPDKARMVYLDDSTPLTSLYETAWKPSLFMRREDSRITLEVTGVRVQRLQDISEADAKAEGVEPTDGHAYRHGFELLWDSINGKRAPWSSNPWVWAVSFEAVK